MEQNTRLNEIPLSNIHIKDNFWNRYISLVKDVIIPYQWDILNDKVSDAEPSHCIQNFKIAAGEAKGEFGGVVFQDTDVAKWLEAVAYTLASHPDEKLEQLADETIDLIGRAQQEDGYLNTYFTIKEPNLRWTNLQEGHELYTAGHMIEAAVAYYEATGKKNFLHIVSRFADVICQTFGSGENQCHGYPGHQEIELALIKLYRVTGKKEYLDTARFFIEQRGTGENYFIQEERSKKHKRIFPEFAGYDPKYSQSHLPVRQQTTAEGHAVRAVYMYCAMADLAYEYQDKSLMQACEALWDNMVQKRMYLTGGIGSSGILERFTTDYDLPNDCNYSESCASIGLALFGKRMAQITQDAKFMDVVERALYNTVLAGIAMDGKSFFYVNPLEVWPDNCMERTSKEHVKPVRQKWFGVACCPPNIARTLASLGQYMYFAKDNTLYFNLYLSNETQVHLRDAELSITMECMDFAAEETEVTISGNSEKETTLAFRVPDYADKFQILRNQEPIQGLRIVKGYAYITDVFTKEKITIKCPSRARFIRANPLVRADIGKTAIVKGPYVYCLEEADNGKNLAALYVDTQQEPKEVFDPNLLGGITVISCKGKRIASESWKEGELYAEKQIVWEEAEIKAVPYCVWGNRMHGEMLVWMKELI